MIGADVEQHRDVERRALDRDRAGTTTARARRRRRPATDRASSAGVPRLPPTCDRLAGVAQHVADQRGGGRLAVGAGDADDASAAGAASREQLDVADHGAAAPSWRASTTGCGSGWVSGMPGASTSASTRVPRRARQIDQGHADSTRPRRDASRRRPTPRYRRRPRPTSARAARQPAKRRAPAWRVAKSSRDADRRSSQLQRREADEREDHRDDPEPDHDGRLGPALLARNDGAAAPCGTRAARSA